MRRCHASEETEVRQGVPQGAVRIVRKSSKPIAQVARDLGVNEGTLGNWVKPGPAGPGGHHRLVDRRYRRAEATAPGERGAADVLLGGRTRTGVRMGRAGGFNGVFARTEGRCREWRWRTDRPDGRGGDRAASRRRRGCRDCGRCRVAGAGQLTVRWPSQVIAAHTGASDPTWLRWRGSARASRARPGRAGGFPQQAAVCRVLVSRGC